MLQSGLPKLIITPGSCLDCVVVVLFRELLDPKWSTIGPECIIELFNRNIEDLRLMSLHPTRIPRLKKLFGTVKTPKLLLYRFCDNWPKLSRFSVRTSSWNIINILFISQNRKVFFNAIIRAHNFIDNNI